MQYLKIKDTIVEQIDAGMLLPKQKLPSERKLAESFDTTRVTLREALSLLEAEGKIYREDRRGWFISPDPLIYNPAQGKSFQELVIAQQRVGSTELIVAKSMLANKQASLLLNLAPFTDVYRVERVRYLDGRPVAYTIHYIRTDLFPKLLSYPLESSLTEIYQTHYQQQYQQVKFRVRTTSLEGKMAQSLRATIGSPATLVEIVHYNAHGLLLDCSLEYWRHDAMCIESVADIH